MTFASSVLALSPWGYWKLDEASGNALDSSGNGRTMTPTGTITRSQSPIAAGLGNSTLFDGSTGYMAAPVATYSGIDSTGISVCAWTNLTTLGANRVLVGASNSSSIQPFKFGQAPSTAKWHNQSFYTGGTDPSSAAAPTAGAYFVVVTVTTAGVNTVYVNGSSVATASGSAFPAGWSGNHRIGCRNDGVPAQFWGGTISDVAVFLSVLSSTDVSNLYAAGTAAAATTPAFHLPEPLRMQAIYRAARY